MPNPETTWDHGDVVRDREDDPDPAIVVNTPGAPADEWDISRFDKTVAEDNPDYPSDVEIVTVVYEGNLREAFSNWTANNPITYATLNE
jgi:ParB family chromosome partitioning protein